jgi:hypothetical protein
MPCLILMHFSMSTAVYFTSNVFQYIDYCAPSVWVTDMFNYFNINAECPLSQDSQAANSKCLLFLTCSQPYNSE